jgi:peptidyl-prolyl cis-trans isomerase A (cyclophilin A)
MAACHSGKRSADHIVINTDYGEINVELFPAKAPKTVAAFLHNIDAGIYDPATFYRVIKIEGLEPEYNSGLVQGGIFQNTAPLPALATIPHESPAMTGLSHTNGTISMARTTPGSATSEFFICIGDQRQFDSSRRTNPDGQGYAAFGRVTSGMDIVRKIQARPNSGEDIISPVTIKSIQRASQ